MTDQKRTNLEERLEKHPHLKSRVESLLNIVENKDCNLEKANEAEKRVIEELRKMGGELLTDWALNLEEKKVEELVTKNDNLSKHGKKNIFWYTTYGEVRIQERAFLQEGKLLRPFSYAADVKCRTYSMPLQRVITDFGADDSFAKANNKLMEHYGITVPLSAPRNITEKHAKKIKEIEENLVSEVPEKTQTSCVIAQTDGSMVPIVDTFEQVEDGKLVDKRKTRKIRYKEARITLAHAQGCVEPVFGGTFGEPDDAGDHLLDCAIRSGLGLQTDVHCVGDGAVWIASQVERMFGCNATFLIDFFHMCEYLGAASKICAPDDPAKWLKEQKENMKENSEIKVLEALLPHIEAPQIKDEKAPVRCCYRYITNRPGQFDYKGAIEKNLPIGSGEIESSHKYIIQVRMEIAGASWKEENAEYMIALRIRRQNKEWDEYWENQ